jgi:hypothetical protein
MIVAQAGIIGVLLICVSMQPPRDGDRAAGDSTALSAILHQWSVRSNATKCLRIECETQHTIAKRSQRWRSPDGRPKRVPPTDTTLDGKQVFVLRDAQLRFERTAPQWSEKRGCLILQHSVFVPDTLLHTQGVLSVPFGTVRKESRPFRPDFRSTLPIALIYRATAQVFPALTNFRATLERVRDSIEGRDCPRVTFQDGDDDAITVTVSVDPTRACLPLRVVGKKRHEARYQISLEYRRVDSAEKWQPTAWTTTIFGPNGAFFESLSARIGRCEINGKIVPEEFALDFPPGTWVRDHRQEIEYVVRADGSHRLVLPEEQDVRNYDRILTTEPGGAAPGAKREAGWQFGILLFATVAIAVLCLATRRLSFLWHWIRK